MTRRWLLACATTAVVSLAIGGCKDDDKKATSDNPNPTSAAPATSTAAPDEPTAEPRATLAPRTPGAAFDDAAAQALLNAVLLGPSDIKSSGWKIQSDTTTDNAAAAAAMPDTAASNERCGRLLGRTITNFPDDPVAAFIGGETIAYFSTATVYKDEAGATDCANENAARLAEPGALAKQFGGVFVDPASVIVSPVGYDTIGDGSFAATLTGQTNAGGMVLDLTILIVAFRSGNVTAAVGSARSGSAPPTSELKPFVDLVLERIEDAQ